MLEDMGLEPGGNLLVFKIKSHLIEEQIVGLSAEQQRQARLNQLADEWAGAGAVLCMPLTGG